MDDEGRVCSINKINEQIWNGNKDLPSKHSI